MKTLTFLALGLLATPALAQNTGTSQEAIVNGDLELDFPATVALGAAGYSMCSGSVIAPHVVLTAGHCVYEIPPEMLPFGRAYFGQQANAADDEVGIVAIVPHPDYVKDVFAYDIGVVELDAPAPVDAVRFRTKPMDGEDLGVELTAVGFGITTGGGQDGGTKRSATISIDQIKVQFFEFNTSTNPNNSNICSGDSGGPSYYDDNGEWVQWGVHSYGDVDCLALGADTRIDEFSDWVLDQVERIEGSRDLCTVNGLRDDGVCDDWCAPVDPDCVPDVPPAGGEEAPTGCQGCQQRVAPTASTPLGLALLPLALLLRRRRRSTLPR